jgi:hypothetical protein
MASEWEGAFHSPLKLVSSAPPFGGQVGGPWPSRPTGGGQGVTAGRGPVVPNGHARQVKGGQPSRLSWSVAVSANAVHLSLFSRASRRMAAGRMPVVFLE